MGVASMIIGIVSVFVGFVPFCGTWAVVPAFVGLGLGIADMVVKTRKKQGRGMAIAGLVLNPLAILIIFGWWALAMSRMNGAVGSDLQHQFQQQLRPMTPVTDAPLDTSDRQPNAGSEEPEPVPVRPALP